ncbi:hypothetical protein NG726_26010 [Pseudomonas sp. MOB-449]|nr:hypothetical protein [Pseudomonas sp. MOB-449]
MTRWAWLLLLLTLTAHAGEPRIRMLAEPSGPLAPGQSLELRVQLLVPTYFLRAPEFPELKLDDGSRATPAEAQNLTERIDGESYAGIQRTYHFPPLGSGRYHLSPQALDLTYADPQSRPLSVRLALPAFSVEVSAAAEPLATTHDSAPQLRISERYTPNHDELHSGDILQRDLRIELQGAGTLLPPNPTIAQASGTRLYRGAAQLSHDEQRGARLSVREEPLRYLLLAPGVVELPAIRLQWRDTRSGQLQQAELPARRLTVLPRPGQRAGTSAPADGWIAALVGLLLVAGATLFRVRTKAWQAERQRWRALRRAGRTGNVRAIEQALAVWLEGLPEAQQQKVRAELRTEIEALQQARYAAQPLPWQAGTLLRQASRLRAGLARRTTRAQPTTRLNP